MMLLSFAVAFIGFIALSLAMKRHYLQLSPTPAQEGKIPSRHQIAVIRIAGYTCLLVSSMFCISSQGISIGLVYWTGILTAAAILQTTLLTYRPQWVIRLGSVLLLAGMVAELIG